MSVDLPSPFRAGSCDPRRRLFLPLRALPRIPAPTRHRCQDRHRAEAPARRRDAVRRARDKPGQDAHGHRDQADCETDRAPTGIQSAPAPRQHAATRRLAHAAGSPHRCGPETCDVPPRSLPLRSAAGIGRCAGRTSSMPPGSSSRTSMRPGSFRTNRDRGGRDPAQCAVSARSAEAEPAGSASDLMSMRQPVSRAASRAFWPSLPIASDSW